MPTSQLRDGARRGRRHGARLLVAAEPQSKLYTHGGCRRVEVQEPISGSVEQLLSATKPACSLERKDGFSFAKGSYAPDGVGRFFHCKSP